MKHLVLTTLILLSCLSSFAQRSCGAMENLQHQLATNPDMAIRMEAIENQTQHFVQSSNNQQRTLITIPVVFHIIHNGDALGTNENISDTYVMAQLDQLNKDCRKLNADASLIPAAFTGVAADAEIEFCLAERKPDGTATTGIEHLNMGAASWEDTQIEATLKPQTIWDSNRYLNIWSVAFGGNSTGLLGYAQFPGGSANTDGVVCLYSSFGSTTTPNPAGGQYAKGRTLTHETGHWLNLYHIWGDANCGNDQVNDTPTQQTSNFGCPTYPHVTCSNGAAGDMFMNYMDYVDDACMYMFTGGQKARIQALFASGGARASLATSNGCTAPDVVSNNSSGEDCSDPLPFCTDSGDTFSAGINQPSAPAGNNYGCLGSQPNPIWYYLKIADPGNINILETNSNAVDVDFALWGPFADLADATNNCGHLGTPIDCSYSTSAIENIDIIGAATGQVYLLLITNFSNAPTDITVNQTGGDGSTDCTILTCPYRIGTQSIDLCANNGNICVPLDAIQPVPAGVIGMNYCLQYDAAVMTPTGIATLGPVVTTMGLGEYSYYDTPLGGTMHGLCFTINYKPSDPVGAQFVGTGNVICVDFNYTGTLGTYPLQELELWESYGLNEIAKCADDGSINLYEGTRLGRIIYWNDAARPLANDPMLCNFEITDCANQLLPIVPNDNGYFVANSFGGNTISISRDICGDYHGCGSPVSSVMLQVNSMDAIKAKQISNYDPSFIPNAYQMIAADVNRSDSIRANDVTAINRRITLLYNEYPQVQNGYPPALCNLSKDWVFVDDATTTNPDYTISSPYPWHTWDGASSGYWRDNVPNITDCLPIPECDSIELTYHSVLLGDVNGSWTSDPADGLRLSMANSMEIDLNGAIPVANNIWDIPVYYHSEEPMHGFDFDLSYNGAKFQVEEVLVGLSENPQQLETTYNNQIANRLLVTAYTMTQVLPTTDPIFMLRVSLNQAITPSDISPNLVLLEGIPIANSQVSITGAATALANTNLPTSSLLINPNPMQSKAQIGYTLPQASQVTLTINDVTGRTVQQLLNNVTQTAGYHALNFDATNLSTGIYFCTLQIGNHTQTQKIVLLK